MNRAGAKASADEQDLLFKFDKKARTAKLRAELEKQAKSLRIATTTTPHYTYSEIFNMAIQQTTRSKKAMFVRGRKGHAKGSMMEEEEASLEEILAYQGSNEGEESVSGTPSNQSAPTTSRATVEPGGSARTQPQRVPARIDLHVGAPLGGPQPEASGNLVRHETDHGHSLLVIQPHKVTSDGTGPQLLPSDSPHQQHAHGTGAGTGGDGPISSSDPGDLAQEMSRELSHTISSAIERASSASGSLEAELQEGLGSTSGAEVPGSRSESGQGQDSPVTGVGGAPGSTESGRAGSTGAGYDRHAFGLSGIEKLHVASLRHHERPVTRSLADSALLRLWGMDIADVQQEIEERLMDAQKPASSTSASLPTVFGYGVGRRAATAAAPQGGMANRHASPQLGRARSPPATAPGGPRISVNGSRPGGGSQAQGRPPGTAPAGSAAARHAYYHQQKKRTQRRKSDGLWGIDALLQSGGSNWMQLQPRVSGAESTQDKDAFDTARPVSPAAAALASPLPNMPAPLLMGMPMEKLESMDTLPCVSSVLSARLWHPPPGSLRPKAQQAIQEEAPAAIKLHLRKVAEEKAAAAAAEAAAAQARRMMSLRGRTSRAPSARFGGSASRASSSRAGNMSRANSGRRSTTNTGAVDGVLLPPPSFQLQGPNSEGLRPTGSGAFTAADITALTPRRSSAGVALTSARRSSAGYALSPRFSVPPDIAVQPGMRPGGAPAISSSGAAISPRASLEPRSSAAVQQPTTPHSPTAGQQPAAPAELAPERHAQQGVGSARGGRPAASLKKARELPKSKLIRAWNVASNGLDHKLLERLQPISKPRVSQIEVLDQLVPQAAAAAAAQAAAVAAAAAAAAAAATEQESEGTAVVE